MNGKVATSHNIVFAKGGVEVIIELPVAFSRACFFVPHFFCNLVPRKKAFASDRSKLNFSSNLARPSQILFPLAVISQNTEI